MWQIAVLALAATAPAGQPKLIFKGQAFGARHTLTCTWFSNFENSRFVQCQDGKRNVLQEGDGGSVNCLPGVCKQMDDAARKAARGTEPDAPSGTFEVVLVGRLGLYPHEKRYIGDASRTVLVEKLKSLRHLN